MELSLQFLNTSQTMMIVFRASFIELFIETKYCMIKHINSMQVDGYTKLM